MTSQSGGGSGSGLPGVTTDGLTPGGEIIAGALTAGDPNAATVPSFHHLRGNLTVEDAPANQIDSDDVMDVYQHASLTRNYPQSAIYVERSSALNGHEYLQAILWVSDSTATTAPAFQVDKGGATQFQVDGDGVQIHGKLKTGASVTHTASVLSGKCVPIYDEAGTLLGYMPLYN